MIAATAPNAPAIPQEIAVITFVFTPIIPATISFDAVARTDKPHFDLCSATKTSTINTKVITAISWGIAGALGAVAAVIYVGNATFSNSLVMTSTQINAFLAGILGGFITFHGPVVGAVIIYLLNAIVGCICVHVPELSMWKPVIVYGIVMLLVLIKPQGLFGKKMVKKV